MSGSGIDSSITFLLVLLLLLLLLGYSRRYQQSFCAAATSRSALKSDRSALHMRQEERQWGLQMEVTTKTIIIPLCATTSVERIVVAIVAQVITVDIDAFVIICDIRHNQASHEDVEVGSKERLNQAPRKRYLKS